MQTSSPSCQTLFASGCAYDQGTLQIITLSPRHERLYALSTGLLFLRYFDRYSVSRARAQIWSVTASPLGTPEITQVSPATRKRGGYCPPMRVTGRTT